MKPNGSEMNVPEKSFRSPPLTNLNFSLQLKGKK